ncbi:protein 4 [Yerba mate chlorosis-associated virus]|uniref:Protein 4 n=1 Tax=Yerba mate chlorosis-associated virus TaxID=2487100 RepID=A0A1W5RXZ4_9RHAB|nr:protein 4 [Yerba mate chlorosis-associated virus]ARA91089.1 protein 4 [Yerba mate chlorosis-associated virus]
MFFIIKPLIKLLVYLLCLFFLLSVLVWGCIMMCDLYECHNNLKLNIISMKKFIDCVKKKRQNPFCPL